MVGLELPVLAMEHMYLVTDDMPEVIEYNQTHGRELPHAIDFEAEIYMRQERNGIVLGTYEKACVPWQPRTTPWDFGAELLPPDLDRISPSLELAFEHFPAMRRPASSASSTARSHSLPTATRSWVRCRAKPASGAPAR